MTKDEALKLALEALDSSSKLINGQGTKFGLEGAMDGYYSGCFDVDGNNKLLNEAIKAIKETLAQPAQEPVAKPYAYEFARDNGDGTYSVFIERGDLIQIRPTVYEYARPKNVHKDHPIKELFDHPPAAQPSEPRNFCPRCGKRTADLTVIHTCTPPEGGYQ